MANPEVQVYLVKQDSLKRVHPAENTSKEYTLDEIKTFLSKELPNFLPFLRALQLDVKNEETFLITTALPLGETVQRPSDPKDMRPEMVWTMGYINRTHFPSHEVLLISSLEVYHGATKQEQSSQQGMLTREQFPLPFIPEVCNTATRQLFTVLSRIPFDPLGPVHEQNDISHSPIILAGTLHSTVASLLAQTDVLVRPGPAFGKYIFSASADPKVIASAPDGSSTYLPEGLIWTTVQPSDYELILSLNPYIRSGTVMAKMHNAAIRHAGLDDHGNPKPLIGFVLEGFELTPRTLHVEPAYRKKGLAKALVVRLLSTGALSDPNSGLFSEQNGQTASNNRSALVFATLEASNIASKKTFESFGAKWHWDTFWLRVNLLALEKAIEEL